MQLFKSETPVGSRVTGAKTVPSGAPSYRYRGTYTRFDVMWSCVELWFVAEEKSIPETHSAGYCGVLLPSDAQLLCCAAAEMYYILLEHFNAPTFAWVVVLKYSILPAAVSSSSPEPYGSILLWEDPVHLSDLSLCSLCDPENLAVGVCGCTTRRCPRDAVLTLTPLISTSE